MFALVPSLPHSMPTPTPTLTRRDLMQAVLLCPLVHGVMLSANRLSNAQLSSAVSQSDSTRWYAPRQFLLSRPRCISPGTCTSLIRQVVDRPRHRCDRVVGDLGRRSSGGETLGRRQRCRARNSRQSACAPHLHCRVDMHDYPAPRAAFTCIVVVVWGGIDWMCAPVAVW